VKTGVYKLAAFVISAFFGGMIGGMIAYFLGSIFPSGAFDPVFDITITLMCFLGGVGTLVGPILGALLLGPLQQYITLQVGSIGTGLDLLVFGALLLIILLFLPEGIVPSLQHLWVIGKESKGKRIKSHFYPRP
jgi:branched-chain amino acid transport system permease protein